MQFFTSTELETVELRQFKNHYWKILKNVRDNDLINVFDQKLFNFDFFKVHVSIKIGACKLYQNKNSCNSNKCLSFHTCEKTLMNIKHNQNACRLNHTLNSNHNNHVLDTFGLNADDKFLMNFFQVTFYIIVINIINLNKY